MADHRDWSSNSNEALFITLRSKAKDDHGSVTFNPAFTYPIFGDEEVIFGYQGLKIRLNFTSDTFKPKLRITSTAQFQALGDTKPDDIETSLRDFLPGLQSNDIAANGDEDVAEWKPPGELLHQYQLGGRQFGIWSTTLMDPRARDLLRNMQILILFFIEGGTYIELDDPDWTMERWRIFFVYAIDGDESSSPSYSFVGYSTAYTLFFLEDSQNPPAVTTPDESFTLQPDDESLQNSLPMRSRISQFLILPPYQSSGHGSHLYNTVFSYFLAQPNTMEIPVEDPNESFDDLRDTSDLIRLRENHPEFTSLSINTSATLPPKKSQKLPTSSILPAKILDSIRKSSKIAERQFARLVEMQLLSRIPPRNRQISRLTRKDKASDENDRAYYFWRLLVKQRLYKHNKASLIQLDLEERIEKLEETLMGVERDYLRLLENADRKARKLALAVAEASEAGGTGAEKTNGQSAGRSLKRRAAVDDDEQNTDDAQTEEPAPTNGHAVSRGVKRRIVDEDEDEDGEEDGDGTAGASPPGKRAKATPT